MSNIQIAFGFIVLVLSAALIMGSEWFLPQGSTATRWYSVIGLLLLFGGLIFLNFISKNSMSEALSELETKSDAILADPFYVNALKIVNAKSEGNLRHGDDSIQDGVEYLVRNGVDEEEARKNLNIVLGSLIIDRSDLHD